MKFTFIRCNTTNCKLLRIAVFPGNLRFVTSIVGAVWFCRHRHVGLVSPHQEMLLKWRNKSELGICKTFSQNLVTKNEVHPWKNSTLRMKSLLLISRTTNGSLEFCLFSYFKGWRSTKWYKRELCNSLSVGNCKIILAIYKLMFGFKWFHSLSKCITIF